MANENNESSGCGVSIGKVIAMISLAVVSVGRFADDIFRGCSHSGGIVDDIGRSASYGDDVGRYGDDLGRGFGQSDDLGRSSNYGDDIGRGTGLGDDFGRGTGYGENASHVGGDEASANEEYINGFFKNNSRFSKTEKQKLLNNLQEASEQTLRQLNQYEDDVANLKSAFGENSELVVDYHNAFNKGFNYFEARQSLLPETFLALPANSKAYQLYTLFKGIPLDKQQAVLLAKLTNKPITPLPSRYSNYVVVEQNEKNALIKTSTSKKTSTINTIANDAAINRKSQIIINGEYDAEIIKELSDKGVKYVRTTQSLIRDVDITADKLNFIYIASKDNEILKKMFQISDEQVDEVISILERVETQPQSFLIDSDLGLTSAIQNVKRNGELPIMIFNNIDNSLFGKDIQSFGIDDFITCRSYGLKIKYHNQITTDYIYFEDFTASIEKAMASAPEDVEQFWHVFSIEYSNRLAQRQANITITVVVGGTVVGGGGYAIYYNNSKK